MEGGDCGAFNHFVIFPVTLTVQVHVVPQRWASLLLLSPWGMRGEVERGLLSRLGDLMPGVQPPYVHHFPEARPSR